MAAVHLTERRVNALQPRKVVRDIRDASLKGFGIRIHPSGRKHYFIHTQHIGRRIWKSIGDASTIALCDARERARSMLAAARGDKPALPMEVLFETVAEEVFDRYGRNWKPRTLAVNKGYLKNQILPLFRGRQITGITATEVKEWFASLHATPVAADRSAPVLSVIMTCAETYGYRPEGSKPVHGDQAVQEEGARTLPRGTGNPSARCRTHAA